MKPILILIIGLLIGGAFAFFIQENSLSHLRKENAALKEENAAMTRRAESSANRATKTPAKTEYIYGVKFPRPTALDDPHSTEAIIPLGTAGSYVVKSTLYSFDKHPNIRILAATDAIVYENFIRSGTQAITPDPNTLASGDPLLVNGVKFCSLLQAKSCVYDEQTNAAVFEKEYMDSTRNQYVVWGVARFFPVSQKEIGRTAAVVIIRVSSQDQQLINWAKEIAIGSDKI